MLYYCVWQIYCLEMLSGYLLEGTKKVINTLAKKTSTLVEIQRGQLQYRQYFTQLSSCDFQLFKAYVGTVHFSPPKFTLCGHPVSFRSLNNLCS
jgi:hypothetical protein